jgi:hypothetical protein
MTSVTTSPATTPTPALEQAPAQATAVTYTPNRTLSIAAFAIAIGSIVFGQTVVLPIVAIVLGIMGYRQEPSGRTFSVFGIAIAGFALFGWGLLGLTGLLFAAPFAFLSMF